MAMDPTASMFAFHDPSSSFFAENHTLGPSSYALPLTDEQDYLNFPNQHPGYEPDGIWDPEDPLSDSVIWALCTNDVPEIPGAGPSGLPGEGCSSHGTINDNFIDGVNLIFGDNNPMPLSVFPVSQSQYNCTCCQILREITHTNGMNVRRLEIHGRFGVITHAVLGTYALDSSFQGQDIQMFDFHNEGTRVVKRFLVQYFDLCKREGYNTLQDPLSEFYEALCVGLNEEPDEPDNPDDYLQLSPEITGDSQREPLKQPKGGSNQVGFMKIPLAMQRERTRKLRLKDFVDYFDLPIEAAARKMNVCPTVVKKICRKNGVPRWPYRKIKSIKRKISKKAKIAEASDDQERARAQEDIQRHQQDLANIYQEFNQ